MTSPIISVRAILITLVLLATGVQAQQQVEPDLIIPQRPYISPSQVSIQAVDVQVTIQDRVATTRMGITLHNPSGSPREARLILPVPSGSAIRSFGLDAISSEPDAVLLPKAEASRIYRKIVSKMVDPGLLEFIGTDLIRSSVFPVPAGEEATFRVTYEHTLEVESGRFEYALPRSQSLGQTSASWTIALDLQTSRPIGLIYSPTHDLDENRLNPDHASIKVLSASKPGPFRVDFVLAGEGGASISTILYPDPTVADGQGGYFMLFLDAPASIGRPAMAREVTLVIDRSGSMRGEKIKQAKAAALQILEALDDGEFFNIIDYSDTIERFSKSPVRKNPETIERVRKYVQSIKAVGGTNIHDALLEAVRIEPEPEKLPIILFLTDGLPTVGQTSESAIRDDVRKANSHDRRIFTFGVGFDVNAPLLTALAQQSRAAPAFVAPGESVEVEVGRVFAKLAGPVLALPELRTVTAQLSVGPSPIREVLPGQLPDVFAGEQLVVLGQYTAADDVTLSIVGQSAGKERRFTTTLEPSQASAANSFVARLWAQRKIATLVDAIRQAGADGELSEDDPRFKELVDEIVALSQRFGILTEYTAFLAVEDAYKKNLEADGAIQYSLGRNAIDERSGQRGVLREQVNQVRQQKLRVDAPAESQAFVGLMEANRGATPGVNAGGAMELFYAEPGKAARAIQSIAGRSFYLRGQRWVEASLLAKNDAKPDQEINFGTEAYDNLVDTLTKEDLQAILGLNVDHEVLLLVDGKAVLIHKPEK